MKATPLKPEVSPENPPRRFTKVRKLFLGGSGLLVVYFVTAYIALPLWWKSDDRHEVDVSGIPRITHTATGIPGDPLNIGLVGSETNIIRAMISAGWYPADPITVQSSLRIAVDSVFRRPDDDAPVSDLYLFGRKQDLAFEQPIGDSPRQRHHVRFWRSDKLEAGRPLWVGSATLDIRVGLSHTTGEVTHHIGSDVDAERDRIVTELQKAGVVAKVDWKNQFHQQLEGKNGGGDPWHTDGRAAVVVLTPLTNTPVLLAH